MNDFTKDELQLALDSLKSSMGEYIEADDKTYSLIDKIQSLIDNYLKCYHRSGIGHYNENGERVGFQSDIYRCRHCNILFRFLFKDSLCIGWEELE